MIVQGFGANTPDAFVQLGFCECVLWQIWRLFPGSPQEEAPKCSSLVPFASFASLTPHLTSHVVRTLRRTCTPPPSSRHAPHQARFRKGGRARARGFRRVLLLFLRRFRVRIRGARRRSFTRAPPGRAEHTPPRLLSSTTDPNTGLRVDTYVKPLGVLRPGEVLNTDPTSDVGRLLRPKMNSTDEPMLVVRLTFDLVNGDTLEPLPLDRLYNHHLVIYSRPDMDGGDYKKPNENSEGGKKKKTTEKETSFRDNPRAAEVVGALAKGKGLSQSPHSASLIAHTRLTLSAVIVPGLHQMNLSAVLAPCGVGAYFAGGKGLSQLQISPPRLPIQD